MKPGSPAWTLYAPLGAVASDFPASNEMEKQEVIGPHDRERNPAAEQLIAILTDDAFDALVEMCRRARVRRAVRVLLVELCRARLRATLGLP